jgi:hypothetical protein
MVMALRKPKSHRDPDFVRANAPPKLLKRLAETPIESLSVQERLKILKEIEVLEKDLEAKFNEAVEADPFWHFKPTDGNVTPEGRALVRKYIKEEDIPANFAGQQDVLLDDSEIRGAFGGNQSGKSTLGAIEAFIMVTGEIPYSMANVYPRTKLPTKRPFHVRVTGEDYENAIVGTLIPTYSYWAPREYLVNQSWEKSYSSSNDVLTLVKDHAVLGTIEFYSNKQEKGSFQGPPRQMMIYDEEPRSDIRQENMMRMTTAEKFRELYCMTHTKGLTWVRNELFENLNSPEGYRIAFWEIASVTNPKANLKVLNTILSNISEYNELQMRLLGRALSLSGRIYGVFSPKVHVVDSFPVNPEDFTVYFGGDLHLSKPSVGVFVAVDREENYYVVTSFKGQLDTDAYKKKYWEIVHDHKFRMAWSAVDRSTDSTLKIYKRGPEDEEGLNIFKAISRGTDAIPALKKSAKYPGSIQAGVDHMIKLFKPVHGPDQNRPRLFIFNVPENRDLIQSYKNMERAEGANEDRTGPIDKVAEGKHDKHAAIRYIFQRNPRWISPDYGAAVGEYEPDNEAVNY